MPRDVHFIKRVTLDEIADAIRYKQASENNFIYVAIPANEFARALRDGEVSVNTPPATELMYKIHRESLADLADVIRSLSGTTDDILGKDMAGMIIDLITKIIVLETPQIEIVDANIGDDEEDNGVNRLDKPHIEILGGDIEEEKPPVYVQVLGTPQIAIIDPDAAEEETPEVVLRPLDTPYITIRGIEGEGGDDEQHEPITLAQPQITIEGGNVSDDVVEPEGTKQLATPQIYIADPNATTPEEPAGTQQLARPSITIENPNAVDGEITTPTITPLAQPEIKLYSIKDYPWNPEISKTTKLEKPTIIIEEYKDVSTNTTAILGLAILGRAILGKT